MTASPAPACTGSAPGFSCVLQQRITEVQHYLAGRHGSIGIVLDDRVTGGVWQNRHAHTLYPAASTMKLAVRQLQHVSVHDQRWGVWGAGPANQPGNKDGWEQDPIGPGDAWWITNTVGFAGAAQEYTLSIMDNVHDYGGTGPRGFFYGANTLTQIASILFQGHHTAAPHPQPSYVP